MAIRKKRGYQARDLGEPLEREVIGNHQTPVVFDKRRNLLLKEDLDIVVQRANALQGCPDPVATIKAMKRAIKIATSKVRDLDAMNHILEWDPALAWLREEG